MTPSSESTNSSPGDLEAVREFVEYLKNVAAKKDKKQLRELVEYLKDNTTKKEEFLLLSKEYLRKYHQLHDFRAKFKAETRVINCFFCKMPPCV
jgi:uncharacterized membrane protein YvbJ